MTPRTVMWTGAALAVLALSVAYWLTSRSRPQGPKRFHVVLIGASIGRGWRLQEWPARVACPGFSAEAIAVWQFDKSEAVEDVLRRPKRKFRLGRNSLWALLQPAPVRPDLVVLKECSAYFPGDLQAYEGSVRKWVSRFQQAGTRVAIATVVPVTRERSDRDLGKQESLRAYNRWARRFALENSLPLLDLAAALEQDGEGGFLRPDFAARDGSHLNRGAYSVLDKALLTIVDNLTRTDFHRAAHNATGQ